jgi:hypothetical protein
MKQTKTIEKYYFKGTFDYFVLLRENHLIPGATIVEKVC